MSKRVDSGGLLIIIGLPLVLFLLMFMHCLSEYVIYKEEQAKEERRRKRHEHLQSQTLSDSETFNNKLARSIHCHQYEEVDLLKFFKFDTVGKHNKSKILPLRKKSARLPIRDAASIDEKSNDDDIEGGSVPNSKRMTSASSSLPSIDVSDVRPPLLLHRMLGRLLGKSQTFDGVIEDENERCSICLELFMVGEVICTPRTGDCNHVFHKECLFGWVKNKGNSECPLCRAVLIKGHTCAA